MSRRRRTGKGWPRYASSAVSHTLSEYESKQLLSQAGVAVPTEHLVRDVNAAVRAADEIGYPAVLKLCGSGIAHKTERDLVRLDLIGEEFVRQAADDLLARRRPDEQDAALLVQPMMQGRRELIAGMIRDAQFGPCVMLGLGGIFAEALGDAAFAVAPLAPFDAGDLIDALEHASILGPFRGEPAVDRGKLGHILECLGRIGVEQTRVESVDVNPLIVVGADPVVVDALVVMQDGA